VVFFVNSLSLAYLAASVPEARSLIDQMHEEARQERVLDESLPIDPLPGRPGDIPE
jgi:preprotein translocase subunit SecG